MYVESVECLITDLGGNAETELKKLKNLKYLYFGNHAGFNSTLLVDLKQLREVHLTDVEDITQIFKEKQQYSRQLYG